MDQHTPSDYMFQKLGIKDPQSRNFTGIQFFFRCKS